MATLTQVPVRDVVLTVGYVLERAEVESVNVVPCVADVALVLICLVGAAVWKGLRRTRTAGLVVARTADDTAVIRRCINRTV